MIRRAVSPPPERGESRVVRASTILLQACSTVEARTTRRHPVPPLLGQKPGRPGLSLLEVLLALAIFLMSLAVIGQLIGFAGDRVLEIKYQSDASRLCQSKMAEVLVGAVPLTKQEDVAFEEEPDYYWSLTPQQAQVAGLWTVTIQVYRELPGGSERPEGSRVECTLTRMMLDPTAVGSTQDVPGQEAVLTEQDDQ